MCKEFLISVGLSRDHARILPRRGQRFDFGSDPLNENYNFLHDFRSAVAVRYISTQSSLLGVRRAFVHRCPGGVDRARGSRTVKIASSAELGSGDNHQV